MTAEYGLAQPGNRDGQLFLKKNAEMFGRYKKTAYLCTRIPQERVRDIGVWCNGNTTDSGPVILGSSPSTPTRWSRRMVENQLSGGFLSGACPCARGLDASFGQGKFSHLLRKINHFTWIIGQYYLLFLYKT